MNISAKISKALRDSFPRTKRLTFNPGSLILEISTDCGDTWEKVGYVEGTETPPFTFKDEKITLRNV